MWTRRTVLIETVMWRWKGTVTFKWRKMRRRRMRMMAKNLGRVARERW
jgi:hypothetical protein